MMKAKLEGKAEALGEYVADYISKRFSAECFKAYNDGQEKARRDAAVNFYKCGGDIDIILKSLNMNIDELKDILAQNNIEFDRTV